MTLADTMFADIDAVTRWQEDLYAHFHRHPELSMQEEHTSAEIGRRLESFSYQVQRIGGGVGGGAG